MVISIGKQGWGFPYVPMTFHGWFDLATHSSLPSLVAERVTLGKDINSNIIQEYWRFKQRVSFHFFLFFSFSHSTLPVKMFGLGQKVMSHLVWSKFWPILANQETLAILHENEAKKIFFFWKKNFKMADWKKLIFQNRQFSKIFRENFMDCLLG